MIPSAAAYYAQAIENMKALQQPQYATYHVHVTSTKVKSTPDFDAQYDGKADTVTVATDTGPASTRSPIFDPTWTGVNDWIRSGAMPDESAPKPTPDPQVSPDAIRTIASVRALGVAYYDVSDIGAEKCANGDTGHAVHLAARKDPEHHSLTHAVIDTTNHQLCEVEFGFRQSGPFSANGRIALDINQVNGTPLVTNERFEFNVHALAIQVLHITSVATFTGFAFPASLPEASPTP